jgi:hypothetical protein
MHRAETIDRSPALSSHARRSANPPGQGFEFRPPDRASRRELFRSLSTAAGLAAFWGATTPRAARASSPEVSADVDPGALVAKLVRRITMGYSEAEVALASQMGYDGYLEYHLNPAAIDDSVLEAQLVPLTTLTMTPEQLYAANPGTIINELIEQVIRRAVFSKRQLFERMVEFWTDHFNIDINDGDAVYLKTTDDTNVIRPHALGSFPAMLDASAHSPAMLYYLDNFLNISGNPQENYARELMELHTLGVDGGYTQQDVQEVARCFTGWTYYSRNAGALTGTFRFRSDRHDNGAKTVLGHNIPAGGGVNDGLIVLDILVNHPSCAAFIAKKLCRWLLGENTPQSIVNDVAATYTATDGDIKAMIRTALKANYLYDAAPRYKRPFHHFVSCMRAVPTTINGVASIRSRLNAAGQVPFTWGPPDGFPDYLDYWQGLILPRWNFGASLMAAQIGNVVVDYTAFFNGLTTAVQCIDRINAALFGGELPTDQRARVLQFMQPDPPNPTTNEKRDALALAMGCPEFQWY